MKAKIKAAHPRTLVTGVTGFLGSHLLTFLRNKKEKDIRLLATSVPASLKKSGAEIVEGSITSPEIVARAVEGVDQIYHLAGRVSRSSEHQRAMYSVHVDGTRILCEAAKKAGVERIVLASSSGTIAITEDGSQVPNESYPTPIEIISRFPYYASKLYQEKTARAICGDDIELIILNPSLLLGPGDKRLSSTRDVFKFLSRDIPAIPTGGINFVDVRDVAPVFYNAMRVGKPGERYLIGGPNWTLERFFKYLERISKVSAPRFKMYKEWHALAAKTIENVYDLLGKTPPLEPISMEMARYFWYVDSSQAERELGFVARDPLETLLDTVKYLRKHFLGDGLPA